MAESEPEIRRKAIADREDEYHAQRLKAVLSPIRADPFAEGSDYTLFSFAIRYLCVLFSHLEPTCFVGFIAPVR